MTSQHWRSLQVICWLVTLFGSALIAFWGFSVIDPGKIAAQSTTVIVVLAVVGSQVADTFRERAVHHERAQEIERRWAERDRESTENNR